jgi:hypothetical protein
MIPLELILTAKLYGVILYNNNNNRLVSSNGSNGSFAFSTN